MANRDQKPGHLSLSRFLPYRLSVLAESVSRAFARKYEQRYGITIPEWRVMAVLGERSPQATQDVIGRTRMDRVRVSRAVIQLAARGLVSRTPKPGDQRARDLRLTPSGRAMYRKIVPLAQELQAALVGTFPPDELQMLESYVARLQECADQL